jgi:hypothetical protein
VDPGGLKKAGADAVTGTLLETRERLASLIPVLAARQKQRALSNSGLESGKELAKKVAGASAGAAFPAETISPVPSGIV